MGQLYFTTPTLGSVGLHGVIRANDGVGIATTGRGSRRIGDVLGGLFYFVVSTLGLVSGYGVVGTGDSVEVDVAGRVCR